VKALLAFDKNTEMNIYDTKTPYKLDGIKGFLFGS
jgi:hypothetical protein